MQNTDGLGRQDHESFHTWAKRIQNAVQYHETCSGISFHEWPPYPRSRQAVYTYIDHIRRIVLRLPIGGTVLTVNLLLIVDGKTTLPGIKQYDYTYIAVQSILNSPIILSMPKRSRKPLGDI
ncbi:unnamed protein product [Rhizophagus irregularis]|nr:unnamed protein product [Rhizophagus irregularis]